jgi:hypothetical protein
MTTATGLMAFWANFEAPEIEALRQWHNCEHMSERVNIPGFLNGRRFRGYDDATTFLMYYETSTPEVLAGPDYQAALNSPTDWTKQALTLFRDPARAIFGLLGQAGKAPSEPAYFLATMRFNVTGDSDAVAQAYRETVLPTLAAADTVIQARLWENQEGISQIKTNESNIYGEGPGRQQFVLFVECTKRPDLLDPAAFSGLSAEACASHVNVVSEVGWLDFALR